MNKHFAKFTYEQETVYTEIYNFALQKFYFP